MQRYIFLWGLVLGLLACGGEPEPIDRGASALLAPSGASVAVTDAGTGAPIVSAPRVGVVVGPPAGGYPPPPPPPPPCNNDGVCDAVESCGAGCQDCCLDCNSTYPPPLNNCCAYLSLPWPYFSCCIQNNGAPIGQWICP